MFDLTIGAALFWYTVTYITTQFLSASDSVSWLIHLSRFSYVFLATLFLTFLIKKTRLYRCRLPLYFIAATLTFVFYVQRWLGSDIFNYFSLFFTNILYCMMIFYSLKDRYLL